MTHRRRLRGGRCLADKRISVWRKNAVGKLQTGCLSVQRLRVVRRLGDRWRQQVIGGQLSRGDLSSGGRQHRGRQPFGESQQIAGGTLEPEKAIGSSENADRSASDDAHEGSHRGAPLASRSRRKTKRSELFFVDRVFYVVDDVICSWRRLLSGTMKTRPMVFRRLLDDFDVAEFWRG